MIRLDNLISAKELAVYLKISIGTIYNLVNKRKIPFYKAGGSLRFSIDDIKKWIRNNKVEKFE